jgi:hypothetical protein
MRFRHGAKLVGIVLLPIGCIASCDNADRDAQVPPKQLTDAGRRGQAFREALLTQWKQASPQLFIDMSALCRETFKNKSLSEANLMMKAAGQGSDVSRIRQAAPLIPPGTTSYGGGLSLHSSIISGASLNVVFYVRQTDLPDGLIVEDVSCGVREVSL